VELRYLVAAGLVAGTPLVAAQAQDAAPLTVAAAVSAATDVRELEELDVVTVTARRREEELQDVPVAISVVDASMLEDTGSFNVARLTQIQPTLQFYAQNPRNSAANIRGLGAPFGLTNDGIEQGVGLYVDDVYYARAAASTFDFLDVERLEVLRGPQGTLYGKNTTAGAINITTRAPTFDPEGKAELTLGNLGFVQAKGALSGPLSDNVAARVAASATSRHGTIFNVATGNRVNEQDNIGVRGQILWLAGDTRVTFSGDYNKQNAECCAQIFVRVGATQRPASRQYWQLAALQDTDPLTPGIQPYAPPSTDPFDRLTDVDANLNARNELGGAAVRVVRPVGRGSFTSVTAWRYWDWLPSNDRDFTGLPVTTKSENPSHQDQYTQEFRYSYVGDRIDYVVGLFGFHQKLHTDGVQQQGAAASAWLLNPTNALSQDPTVLLGLTSYNDIDLRNTSAALFGQLSFKVNDRFRVEPGLRLNWDKKKGSYHSTVVNGDGVELPVLSTDPAYADPRLVQQRSVLAPQHYDATFKDWNLSGDLKLAYEINPDVLTYVTYARSFKTGGITLNGVPTDAVGNPLLEASTVDPEKVNSYEAGVKTQFLNRTATLNVAGFWTEVNDFQTTVTNNAVGVLRGYLAGAEKVRVRGVEADFSWDPNDRWSIYVNGAFTDGKYVSFPDAPCPPELAGGTTASAANPPSPPGTPGGFSPANCDISGQWIAGISRWAGAWGFQYKHPANLLGREGQVYFAYDGSARSRFSSNPSRSIYTDVGGYGLANFRVGFRSNGNWDVYGWVKNAFDKKYFEQLATTPGNTGLIAGQPADPRTWGVTVQASF
jgi:iron complex outermembrane receptor protein